MNPSAARTLPAVVAFWLWFFDCVFLVVHRYIPSNRMITLQVASTLQTNPKAAKQKSSTGMVIDPRGWSFI
jgi:hypothetical protein